MEENWASLVKLMRQFSGTIIIIGVDRVVDLVYPDKGKPVHFLLL